MVINYEFVYDVSNDTMFLGDKGITVIKPVMGKLTES